MSLEIYLPSQRNVNVSTNFKAYEFASKDTSQPNEIIIIDAKIVSKIQQIRNKFGVTKITSAYRTPAHNKKVGGSTNSNHQLGIACDIQCPGAKMLDVAKFAVSIGLLGVGYYPVKNFVHVDLRENKYFWIDDGKERAVSGF